MYVNCLPIYSLPRLQFSSILNIMFGTNTSDRLKHLPVLLPEAGTFYIPWKASNYLIEILCSGIYLLSVIKIFSRKVIYNLCNYLLLITPDSIILLITITFLKKNYLLHSITVINDFITYYFDYILDYYPKPVWGTG